MSVFSEVIFDPSFKLSGSMLVEASAGTGKTYNIQNAFLRLVMAAGLPVQNILVVTFTEAATHELRTRLRAILALCRTFLEWRLYNPAGTCPIAEQEDRDRLEKACRVPLTGSNTSDGDQERLARVRLAIMDFDGSAVFTIHGFCKRVLDRYAFECGHDPDAELLPDPGLLLEEICQDWWRERTYTNKSFRAQVPFRNVDEFTRLVHLVFDRPDARIEPSEKTLEAWEDLKQKALASLDSFHTSQDKEWKTWTRNPAAEEFLALLSRIRDALNPGNLPALRILLKDFSKTASEATWSEPQTLPSELYTLGRHAEQPPTYCVPQKHTKGWEPPYESPKRKHAISARSSPWSVITPPGSGISI